MTSIGQLKDTHRLSSQVPTAVFLDSVFACRSSPWCHQLRRACCPR
ncbi:hypothetical protein AWT69_001908 [Pseudomonas putida]|nr:hypothetical protein AWT69_001908 [Pseudomonas putida]